MEFGPEVHIFQVDLDVFVAVVSLCRSLQHSLWVVCSMGTHMETPKLLALPCRVKMTKIWVHPTNHCINLMKMLISLMILRIRVKVDFLRIKVDYISKKFHRNAVKDQFW